MRNLSSKSKIFAGAIATIALGGVLSLPSPASAARAPQEGDVVCKAYTIEDNGEGRTNDYYKSYIVLQREFAAEYYANHDTQYCAQFSVGDSRADGNLQFGEPTAYNPEQELTSSITDAIGEEDINTDCVGRTSDLVYEMNPKYHKTQSSCIAHHEISSEEYYEAEPYYYSTA